MVLSRIVRFLEKKDVAPAALPPGLRIYAIGDVHGRLDLLNEMLEHIEDDIRTAPSNVLTICLGDYVDRGNDSRGVIERLCAGRLPTPLCALRGNHEDLVLKFLDDATVLDSWRKWGGLETLHSYGIDVRDAMRGHGYDVAREAFCDILPNHHRQFLEQNKLSASFGDYFFCHAGVRPGVPLEQQAPHDLLWIREEFLHFPGRLEKVVVHGHTPVESADVRPNRINIDTGAFATSKLTALVLEGTQRRFITSGTARAASPSMPFRR
jgi:serine/threonine protein phosphatase 1